MYNTRPGFTFYFADWKMARGLLQDAEFLAFHDAVVNFAETGEEPENLNRQQQYIFNSFKSKLEHDAQKYWDKVEKTRAAGKQSHKNKMVSDDNRSYQDDNKRNQMITNTNTSTNTSTNKNTKPNENTNTTADDEDDNSLSTEYKRDLSHSSVADFSEIREDELPF